MEKLVNSSRYYFDKELAFPSVTTILSVINKGFGLEKWKLDNMFKATYESNGTKEDAYKIYEKNTSVGRDIGSRVHAHIENIVTAEIEGKPYIIPEYRKDEMNPLKAFAKWKRDNEIHYIANEQKVINKDFNYAGRFDLVAQVNGDICLIDVKCSKACQFEYGLQLSAYFQAYDEDIDKLFVLRLDKETGNYQFKEYQMQENWEAFKSANALWKTINKWSEEKSRKMFDKYYKEEC